MSTLAVEHGARTHHKFSPSKVNYIDPRVGGCLGFRSANSTSQAAEDGTELHETCESVLRGFLAQTEHKTVSAYADTVRRWDDDSNSLLQFCFRRLDEWMLPGTEVHIELRAELTCPDSGAELNHGYLDLLLIHGTNDGRRMGRLIDWKFGSVPVVGAGKNRQGWCYAAGMFAAFPDLASILVTFVQPRLDRVSEHLIWREEIDDKARDLREVIQAATATQSMRILDRRQLSPGSACKYCDRVAECPAYLRTFQLAAERTAMMPLPKTFDVEQIDTPEKAAIVKAWLDFIGDAEKPLKARILEIAHGYGGTISCEVPGGETIAYKVSARGVPRSLGNPVEIGEALKDFVEPAQLLGAATLSLDALVDLLVPAMQEINPSLGTKKAARQAVEGLLEAQGLLTQPDGKIYALRRVKIEEKEQQ